MCSDHSMVFIIVVIMFIIMIIRFIIMIIVIIMFFSVYVLTSLMTVIQFVLIYICYQQNRVDEAMNNCLDIILLFVLR